jgi:hypothetical protein
MKKNNYVELYKTKDIYIAATLFACDFEFEETEWTSEECFFVFRDKDKAEEAVRKYFTNELRVSPRLLFDSFKNIKALLYNK